MKATVIKDGVELEPVKQPKPDKVLGEGFRAPVALTGSPIVTSKLTPEERMIRRQKNHVYQLKRRLTRRRRSHGRN